MVDAAVELQQPAPLVRSGIPGKDPRTVTVDRLPCRLEQRVVVGRDRLAYRKRREQLVQQRAPLRFGLCSNGGGQAAVGRKPLVEDATGVAMLEVSELLALGLA